METKGLDLTPRQAAWLSGGALVVMVIAVAVALPQTLALVVTGDAGKTTQAIQQAGAGFRIGLVGWCVVLFCDVLVSYGLYEYFKSTHKGLSLLTAWIRLFYTALFAAALIHLVVVPLIMYDAPYLSAFSGAQKEAMVLFSINVFQYAWMFALGFFGLHLFGLGVLALRCPHTPKLLGYLLILASLGYVLDTLAFISWSDYKAHESTIKAIVAAPNAIGELSLAFWLLFKGGKGR